MATQKPDFSYFETPLQREARKTEAATQELLRQPAPTPPEISGLDFSEPAQVDQPRFDQRVTGLSSGGTKVGELPADAALRRTFEDAAREYGVPVNVLMAIAQQESGYNATALGQPTQYGRAQGIMQYIPSTAAGMGINPYDARASIRAAAKQYADRIAKGDSPLEAVQAHFGGDNRKQWGPLTRNYGQEVMGRAGDIGRLLQEQMPEPEPEPSAGAGRGFVNPPAADPNAPRPVQEKEEGPGFADNAMDVLRSLGMGSIMAAQDVREVLRRGSPITRGAMLASDVATIQAQKLLGQPQELPDETLKKGSERLSKAMTPQQQAASAKEWITQDEDGKYHIGPAWTDWRAYSSGIAQSLPEQALTMFPAAKAAKTVFAAKIAAGATEQAAGKAAARVAMAVGASSEGLLGGAQSAREVRDTINELPIETLQKSQAFQSMVDKGISPEDAKRMLAEDQATQAFLLSGVATAAFGGMGDRALAKIITEKVGKSALRRVASAIAREATSEGLLEELPQSALQQLAQNYAIQKANPEQRLSENVANQAAGGAVLGAIQGGAIGGGAAAMRGRARGPVRVAPTGSGEQTTEPVVQTAPEAAQQAGTEPIASPVVPQPVLETKEINPRAAGGPVGRSVEAGIQSIQQAGVEGIMPRVTVRTPLEGDVSGTLVEYNQKPNGQWEALILGDDGGQRRYTSQDDVQMVREGQAMPEAAPDQITPEPVSDTKAQIEAIRDPSSQKNAALITPNSSREGVDLAGLETVETPRGLFVTDDAQKAAAVKAMGESITDQQMADMLGYTTPKTETDGTTVQALDKDGNVVHEEVTNEANLPQALEQAQQMAPEGGSVRRTDAMTAQERRAAIEQRESTRPEPIDLKAMNEDQLRARLKYVAQQVKINQGADKNLVAARREVEREIARRKEQADEQPATGSPIRVADGRRTGVVEPAAVATGEPTRGVSVERSAGQQQRSTQEPVSSVREVVPDATRAGEPAADLTPAEIPTARKIDPAAGRWFSTQEKAEAKMKSLGLTNTHEVRKTGKVRYEIKPKDVVQQMAATTRVPELPTQRPQAQPTPATETAPAAPVVKESLTTAQTPSVKDSLPVQAPTTEESSAVQAPSATDAATQLATISDADLSSMIDSIAAEDAAVVDTSKPARTRKKRTTPAKGKAKAREQQAPAEKTDIQDTAAVERTASEIAKSLGHNVSSAGMEAIRGLTELFGGSGRFSSGLSFDEQTYAKAKPHFEAMLRDAQAAGKDLKDFVRTVLRSFGTGVKPYLMRFAKDTRGEQTTSTQTAGKPTQTVTNPTTEEARAALESGKSITVGDTVAWIERSPNKVGYHAKQQIGNGPVTTLKPEKSGPMAAWGKEYAARRALEGITLDNQIVTGDSNESTRSQERAGQRVQTPEASAVPVSGQEGAASDAGRPDGRARADSGRELQPDNGQPQPSGQPGVRPGSVQTRAGIRGEGQRGTAQRARPSSERNRQPLGDFHYAPGELARDLSWKGVARRNIEIIELVKKLDAEGRQATPDERMLISRFTGWGASELANGLFADSRGNFKEDWKSLAERLQAALTPEEYAAARRSTQYAHYTSEGVIRSIYGALEKMGFQGGRVLEPGMGIGLFKGLMPEAMSTNTQYIGIEVDPLTAAIAKQLYPQSNILSEDFTKTDFPRDYFDAAIGNPPFSSTRVLSDPEYRSNKFMLHDYFFAKTLDRVKPGGLLVFVSSKGTMDKANSSARKYMAQRANLLGAVRLPQTAFKENAGTEVVTDVLFLQKKGPGIEDNGIQWMGLAEVPAGAGMKANVNEYFAAHPDMVLGAHAMTGSMYRANEYTVTPRPGDIEQQFAQAIERLPAAVFRPELGSEAQKAQVTERDFNPTIKKEGSVYVDENDTLRQVQQGSGVVLMTRLDSSGKEVPLKPREVQFLKDYSMLRDALKRAQYDQLNDTDAWETSLAALNEAYTEFTKAHGSILAHTITERINQDGTHTVITRWKNGPLLRMDAEAPLVKALEEIKPNGEIVKGKMLTGRVLNKPKTVEIQSVQDALLVSLNKVGRLDMDEIARLAGTTREQAIEQLGTAIYNDPSKGWVMRDEYLSGNVVRKLKQARNAAKADPKLKRNVEALEAVQPPALAPADITAQLGSRWVPPSDVIAFTQEVLNQPMEVSYHPLTKTWRVEPTETTVSEWNLPNMSASAILESTLNSRQIRITRPVVDETGTQRTMTDLDTTEAANAISAKMNAEFQRWIWSDTKRADRLTRFYNENYNNIVPREFDGEHLQLPGTSSRIALRPLQKRAIWRIVQTGDVEIAHAVGAGKTFSMIAAAMEERRLGLIKKPMFAVPNHMLNQFANEFLELYPTAHIMVADEENFQGDARKQFVARAALNDPDAIIITHSAFGRIGLSTEASDRYIRDQIDHYVEIKEETKDRLTVKQLERTIEQLENRLSTKAKGRSKDAALTFEELGVDRLYVDEFHEFRKLDFATNQSNIKGIDPNGSQRAMDLHMKVQYLQEKNPGRALVGATGTPITNTMGELFTAQRFFQPQQLEEDGLDSFDAWAAQFGQVVNGFEQNPAGGYEVISRFAKFVNVPDLMSRVRSFMDVITKDQLGTMVDRPKIKGGARQIVVTPSPKGYKEYQKQLNDRIEAIRKRKGTPKPGDDIILTVIGDGRFSAIDMRFVDPTLPPDPQSKLNRVIADVVSNYHEKSDWQYHTNGVQDALPGAAQMVFTDIGLGEQSARSRGFDMKAWITQELIRGGVDPQHIAFMRDHKTHAKKQKLFEDLRSGKKRILIGGKDMETGVNAQKRLADEIHLDAPWFPASVEQREGRIERQGNQNTEIEIKAYATKGSYDSTMWGANARKQRFISQAMQGDSSVRSLEDVSEASSFEMASALASGDERYLQLAGLRADVERLSRLYSSHETQQRKMRSDKIGIESGTVYRERLVGEIEQAIKKRKPIGKGEDFTAEVNGAPITGREDFSQAVFHAFQAMADARTEGTSKIGSLAGFNLTYNGQFMKGSGDFVATVEVDLPGQDTALVSFPIDPELPISGIAQRATNQINRLDADLNRVRDELASLRRRMEQIDSRLGQPFPDMAELVEKRNQADALESELAAETAVLDAAQDAEAVLEQQEQAAGTMFSVTPPIDQTQTEAFKMWFGNSKVVDAQGNPLVVYHGTPDMRFVQEEGRFKSKQERFGFGEKDGVHWFTDSHQTATTYADARRAFDYQGAEPGIVAAYLKIENPLVIDAAGEKWRTAQRGKTGNVIRLALEKGHDGIIIKNVLDNYQTGVIPGDVPVNTYAVFNSQQIKSATENIGTFDATNPDIRYSMERGPLEQTAIARPGTEAPNVGTATSTLEAITSGDLKPTVTAWLDAGRIELHQEAPRGAPAGADAWTTPDGRIHLVDNLPPTVARAKLMHEMFHAGVEPLVGTVAWNRLQDDLGVLFKRGMRGDGAIGEFFMQAQQRLLAARAAGDLNVISDDSILLPQEFGAYAVEQYEQAPAALKSWARRAKGEVQAWALRKFGKQLGAVTPEQLSALTRAALNAGARTEQGLLAGQHDTAMYTTSQREQALDDAIGSINPTQTDAFKRWFGDSKVVDVNGKPLVVYHGTASPDITAFIPQAREATSNLDRSQETVDWFRNLKRNNSQIGTTSFRSGTFFSPDPSYAGNYVGENGGVMYPVYIKAENPIYKDMRTGKVTGTDKTRTPDALILTDGNEIQEIAVIDPTQVKSAIGNDGSYDVHNPDIRYSVAPPTYQDPKTAYQELLGVVRRDIGRFSKYIAHPRHVAAVYRAFAPVYQSVMDRMSTRDRIITDLNRDYEAYAALPYEGKRNVNKALELGRLTGKTYSDEDLAKGITNPGYKMALRFDEQGAPRQVRQDLKAKLTKPAERINLTPEEINAYRKVRDMMDHALDLLQVQTLDDMGFPELAADPSKVRQALIDAKDDPKQFRKLQGAAKFIAEIEQAKRTGYVPFSRFGDYVIAVKRDLADIQYARNPQGGWTARNVPQAMQPFLEQIGATYDNMEGGWKLTPEQRNALRQENSQTVYSEKVEIPLRDKITEAMVRRREGRAIEIPAVKAAYDRIQAQWAPEGSGNRMVEPFAPTKRRPEQKVSIQEIDALADVASIDNPTWDAIRDKLQDAIQSLSFRKHFFQSDNVPGYSVDFERAITEYMGGMAGYLARREHQKQIDNAVNSVQAENLHKYAQDYVAYTDLPQEELALLRQLGFFTYIAGNVSSGIVNLTQQAIMTFPTLSQVANPARVSLEMARANKDALKMMTATKDIGLNMFDPRKAPPDVREDLIAAWENGDFIPTATIEIMATANQRNVGGRKLRRGFDKATQAVGLTFSVPERINRLATYIAAHRIARMPGMRQRIMEVYKNNELAMLNMGQRNNRLTELQMSPTRFSPAAYAEYMVDETQFRMGKANRPTISRGPGAAIMQFKGFMMQSFEAWARMAMQQGPRGKVSTAMSMAILMALSGLWGFPGADDARQALEKLLGYMLERDVDLRTDLRRRIYEATGSQWIAAAADRGLPFPMGLDLGRVGLGNVAPNSGDITDLLGIPYDLLVKRPMRAIDELRGGNVLNAIGAVAPKFVGNLAQAFSMVNQGFRDTKGRTVLSPDDITAADVAQKAIGFTPTSVTAVREARYATQRMQTAADAIKQRYTQRIATLLGAIQRSTSEDTRKDLTTEYRELLAEIQEYNRTASPEAMVNITPAAMRNAMRREMQGLPGQFGRERKAARGRAAAIREVYGVGMPREDEQAEAIP